LAETRVFHALPKRKSSGYTWDDASRLTGIGYRKNS
jgi:hypothetical protein